jgi:hypothetical protein
MFSLKRETEFTVKELTRLLSIREVPSLELLGQIIRFF